MGRRRVDLKKILPTWAQYLVALAVVAGVVALAWWWGRDRPLTPWIEHILIPAWRWIGVVVLCALILRWLARRLGR